MSKAIVNFAVTDLKSFKTFVAELSSRYKEDPEDLPLIMAHVLNPVDLAALVEYSKEVIAKHPELERKINVGLTVNTIEGPVVAYSDGGYGPNGEEKQRELIGFFNRGEGYAFTGFAPEMGVSAPGTYKPAAALAAAKRIVGYKGNNIDRIMTQLAQEVNPDRNYQSLAEVKEDDYDALVALAHQRAPLDHEVVNVMSYLLGHVSNLSFHAGAVFFNQGYADDNVDTGVPSLSELAAAGLTLVADPSNLSVPREQLPTDMLLHGVNCDASPKFLQNRDAVDILIGEPVQQEPLEIYFADLRAKYIKGLPAPKTSVFNYIDKLIDDVPVSLEKSPPCLTPPANEWPLFRCPSADEVARGLFPDVLARILEHHREYVAADGKLSPEEVEKEVTRYRDEEVIPRLTEELMVMREASDYLDQEIISYFLPSAAMIGNARNVYGGSSVGTGRGSGAGSMWAQGLGLTTIDPIRHKLLFARFITVERLCNNLAPLFATLSEKFPQIFPPTTREDYRKPIKRQTKMATLRQYLLSLEGDIHSDPVFSELSSFMRTAGHMTELRLLEYALSSDLPPQARECQIRHALNGMRGNMPDLDLDFTTSLRDRMIADCGKIWRLLTASADSTQNVTAWIRRCINVGMPSEELDERLKNAPKPPYDIPPLWKQVPLLEAADDPAGKMALAMRHEYAEKNGQIKFDMLGLTEGDKITVSHNYISERIGEPLVDIRHIEAYLRAHPEIIERMKKVLSLGVNPEMFQFTGEAGLNLLQRLVRAFGDKMELLDIITLANALNRPGPLAQGMPEMILAKAAGHATDEKPYEKLPLYREITDDTFGALVYQEQVMAIAVRFANYTAAESDELRAAMGKKKVYLMNRHRIKFLAQSVLGVMIRANDPRLESVVEQYGAALSRGAGGEQVLRDLLLQSGIINEEDLATARTSGKELYSINDMNALFDSMAAFAEYGFNKSHALAYAIYPYMTLYLATAYPKEYITCVLRTQKDPNIPRLSQLAEALGGRIVLPTAAHTNTEVVQVGDEIRLPLNHAKNVDVGIVKKMETLPEDERCLSSILTAVEVKIEPTESDPDLQPFSLSISADFSEEHKKQFAKRLAEAVSGPYKIVSRSPLFTPNQIANLILAGTLDNRTPLERARFDIGSYRIPSFVQKLSASGAPAIEALRKNLSQSRLNSEINAAFGPRNGRAKTNSLNKEQLESLFFNQVSNGIPSFEDCISSVEEVLPPITKEEVEALGRDDVIYCEVTPDPFVSGKGNRMIKLSLRDLNTNHVYETIVFESNFEQYAMVAGITKDDYSKGRNRSLGDLIGEEINAAKGKSDVTKFAVLRPYISAFVLRDEFSKRTGQLEKVIDWRTTMSILPRIGKDLKDTVLIADPDVEYKGAGAVYCIRHTKTKKTKNGNDYEEFEFVPMEGSSIAGSGIRINLFGQAPEKFAKILGARDLNELKEKKPTFYAPAVISVPKERGKFPEIDLRATSAAIKALGRRPEGTPSRPADRRDFGGSSIQKKSHKSTGRTVKKGNKKVNKEL